MSRVYVKPPTDGEGHRILTPQHPTLAGPGERHLPPEGEWWPQDAWTAKRLRDRDVVEATPPKSRPETVEPHAAEEDAPAPEVVPKPASKRARRRPTKAVPRPTPAEPAAPAPNPVAPTADPAPAATPDANRSA